MKKKFSCPISPYIMWDRGFVFTDCPMSIHGRDMPQCENCHLKGKQVFKFKQERHEKQDRQEKQVKQIKVEKKIKAPIPKIGKTYNS